MFYIDVEPTSFGASLPQINIFMAVLECFLYLAPKTSGEILLAFSVTPFTYDVALRLEPIFRREEPFFDHGVAGLGLATVPSKMISERHQQWTEMGFNYKVDDALIEMGEIVRGRRLIEINENRDRGLGTGPYIYLRHLWWQTASLLLISR